MMELNEATGLVWEQFSPLPAERVNLSDALGRFLAMGIRARQDDPPFDNSAMDGYAVRAADLESASQQHPVALRIVGESRAGVPATAELSEGEAVRIFTGAQVPAGADTVVMQEDTVRAEDEVSVSLAPERGRHIRFAGEVVRATSGLLGRGAELRAGEIGFAASQGYAVLPVHRRPRVAILSTGDELRELGEPANAGLIYDSNTHGLAAAVRAAGGVPVLLPLGADSADKLQELITQGLETDLLITTGGVSVGDYDLVHEAFEACGIRSLFWKVRMKPGKPVRFGVSERGTPVLGLPGNPVSALVTFEVFGRPALRTMLGDASPHRGRIPVTLSRPLEAPRSRTELARARLEGSVAHPAARGGSANMTSLVGLDALVILPAGAGRVTEADALDLRSGRGTAQSPWET